MALSQAQFSTQGGFLMMFEPNADIAEGLAYSYFLFSLSSPMFSLSLVLFPPIWLIRYKQSGLLDPHWLSKGIWIFPFLFVGKCLSL